MSINDLNRHPLNEAALFRLQKENQDPDSDLIHLLSLAYIGMTQDEDGVDPFSPEGKILRDWTAGRNLQAAALENLEDAVSLEEIQKLPLPQLAEQIVGTLQAAQYRGVD